MSQNGGRPRRRKTKNKKKKFCDIDSKTRLGNPVSEMGDHQDGDVNKGKGAQNCDKKTVSDDQRVLNSKNNITDNVSSAEQRSSHGGLGVELMSAKRKGQSGVDENVYDDGPGKGCKGEKKRPLSDSAGVSPDTKKVHGDNDNDMVMDGEMSDSFGSTPVSTPMSLKEDIVGKAGPSGKGTGAGVLGRWYNKVFGESPPLGSVSEEVRTDFKKDYGPFAGDGLFANDKSHSGQGGAWKGDDEESDKDIDEELERELEKDETGMARVITKVMRGENKRLSRKLDRLEFNVKEQTARNFEMFVKYMQKNYDAMEEAVEKRLEEKFQKKYDEKISAYEAKVNQLESEMKNIEVGAVAPSDDAMLKVRNEILDGLDRSKSVAKCLDSMVKQRIERKMQSGELTVNAKAAREVASLNAQIVDIKSQVKKVQQDVYILNPDPFAQEHLCIVCSGVEYFEGEDVFQIGCDILLEIKRLYGEEGYELDCDSLRIIDAKRLGSINQRFPLLKIALGSQEMKVAILKAKHVLAQSDDFYRVRVRSTKSDATRAMEDNMRLVRDNVPGLQNYKLTGNSRLVSRDGSRGSRGTSGGGRRSRGENVGRQTRPRRRVSGSRSGGRGRSSQRADAGHSDYDSDEVYSQPGAHQRGRGVTRGRYGSRGRHYRSRGSGRGTQSRDDGWGSDRPNQWGDNEDSGNYDIEYPRMNIE